MLIPDSDNRKAIFMTECPDVNERKAALSRLQGVENRLWIKAEGCTRKYAIADEHLDRSIEEKTSRVHFLRFQLDPQTISFVTEGANISNGCNHRTMSVAGMNTTDA